jgi:hypothetical protein
VGWLWTSDSGIAENLQEDSEGRDGDDGSGESGCGAGARGRLSKDILRHKGCASLPSSGSSIFRKENVGRIYILNRRLLVVINHGFELIFLLSVTWQRASA